MVKIGKNWLKFRNFCLFSYGLVSKMADKFRWPINSVLFQQDRIGSNRTAHCAAPHRILNSSTTCPSCWLDLRQTASPLFYLSSLFFIPSSKQNLSPLQGTIETIVLILNIHTEHVVFVHGNTSVKVEVVGGSQIHVDQLIHRFVSVTLNLLLLHA